MNKIQTTVVSILAAIFVALAIVTLNFALKPEPSATDRFIKPEFDTAAVAGIPENINEDLRYQSVTFTEGFSIAMCADPVLSEDGNATLYFTSPADNTVWVRVIIYDENDKEIGTSGVLKPGEYVKSVKLQNAKEGIVTAKIVSYQPETYYSQGTANLEIKLTK